MWFLIFDLGVLGIKHRSAFTEKDARQKRNLLRLQQCEDFINDSQTDPSQVCKQQLSTTVICREKALKPWSRCVTSAEEHAWFHSRQRLWEQEDEVRAVTWSSKLDNLGVKKHFLLQLFCDSEDQTYSYLHFRLLTAQYVNDAGFLVPLLYFWVAEYWMCVSTLCC